MENTEKLKEMVEQLMFYGCQKLTAEDALELSKNILQDKVPMFNMNSNDISFEEKVNAQSIANKNAAIEAMSKFIPEKISEADAFNSEVNHWHKSFLAAAISGGNDIPGSFQYAKGLIRRIYGETGVDAIQVNKEK